MILIQWYIIRLVKLSPVENYVYLWKTLWKSMAILWKTARKLWKMRGKYVKNAQKIYEKVKVFCVKSW